MKEIDVDDIMNQIRSEVKMRKEKELSTFPSHEIEEDVEQISKSDWDDISWEVNNLRYFCDLENNFIQIGEINKTLRRAAHIRLVRSAGKFLFKVLLYMLSRVFRPQILFNRSIISSMERIISKVKQDEQITLKDDRELHKFENALKSKIQEEYSRLEEVTFSMEKRLKNLSKAVLDQERRVTLLLDEARRRLPEPISKEQIKNMLEEDHLLDAMYVSFEDQFRGTREDIKERQKVYLPYIKRAKAGTKQASVLDIGCGRGEWLEILKEEEFIAKGVDYNRVMIEQCNERGLEVTESDVIEYLRNQKAKSFGAVTGFHIVEHLPLKRLITLFDEALRVLIPGGIVIFETPNPENIIVGSCNFFIDPTHKNPIPPDTLKYLLKERGFDHLEIMRLHPLNIFEYEKDDELKHIVHRFNMEQDYSVIAVKE